MNSELSRHQNRPQIFPFPRDIPGLSHARIYIHLPSHPALSRDVFPPWLYLFVCFLDATLSGLCVKYSLLTYFSKKHAARLTNWWCFQCVWIRRNVMANAKQEFASLPARVIQSVCIFVVELNDGDLTGFIFLSQSTIDLRCDLRESAAWILQDFV